MTMTNEPGTVAIPTDAVNFTIDGIEMQAPKGTLVIRAAELIGIEIPRFCDHPLLVPVAACRACLIEVDGVPKPQPACAQMVAEGMNIHTQYTSQVAAEAQAGVMEFLLVNHPLDCPVCDKGGECPLQNQAMTVGRPETRFIEEKRTFPKPINVSAQILLDRERCVSCARCTRFAEQIAGDPMIELLERGAQQQVGTADDEPFDSYFSGNTIQICPVGALTSADYRFRARPFDLVSVPTTCEHCASGCSLRTDYRRGVVTRRLAWDDPEVNEEWNCDKGRFAFRYQTHGRITSPLIRENGELRVASWPEALDRAAQLLTAARGNVGVLVGGRSTVEDAYAYATMARTVLDTDDIDFRSRASSDEEAAFLISNIAGTPVTTTYGSLESAPIVLLVDFEPEDESPIVFLRLRKAARGRTRVVSVASHRTRGAEKMRADFIACAPGDESRILGELPADVRTALSEPGAVIMVGERAAALAGAFTAVAELANSTGAALVWVPRRAGERSALDAGALAGVLTGGRPLTDTQAREEAARVWGVAPESLPQPGRSGRALLERAAHGEYAALLIGGVEVNDHDDAHLLREALSSATPVVALSTHHNEVTAAADVVFPVGVVTEKAGTFLDWEGRPRPFGQVLHEALTMSDAAVLSAIADVMGAVIEGSVTGIRRQIGALGPWRGARAQRSSVAAPAVAAGVRIDTWRELLDLGLMQSDEPHLAATARPSVARLSAATAAKFAIADVIVMSGPAGNVTLPTEIIDIVDDVVWVPMNSVGCRVYQDLGLGLGDLVTISAGERL